MKTGKKAQKSQNSLTRIVVWFALANVFALAVFFYTSSHEGNRVSPRVMQETNTIQKTPSKFYQFENPNLAVKVFDMLDVFEPVEDSFFAVRTKGHNKYHEPWLGLKNDDEYCHKARAAFVDNPTELFERINFITAAPPSSLMRNKVISAIGYDIQPHIGSHMPKKQKEAFTHDLRPDAHLIFSSTGPSIYKHVGKNIACITQASSHIPGHATLNRKDWVAEAATNYGKKFEGKPQCFSHEKFFPETWLLYDKEACQEFFAKINSPEYQKLKEERSIVYIRKIGAGSHRGHGVSPVNEEEEASLRTQYKNGELCGSEKQNYIIQTYIHNPLLLQGRKFDFRIYMLIASTNPMIAFYHDGFLRVSLDIYDKDNKNRTAHLTNLSQNKKTYEAVKNGELYNGMDEEGLKVAQQWDFERLHKELFDTGVVTDPDWLDNYLRPEFKKAMIHLLRMSSHNFLKRSSLYELYGVDFMLDQNLNIWFIEANSGPALGGYSQPMEIIISNMIKDHFLVMMSLIRSRMLRVYNHINKMIETGVASQSASGAVVIQGLDQRIAEFQVLSQNAFEKEFEPTAENGFRKIIDENYFGTKRYSGLLSEECL